MGSEIRFWNQVEVGEVEDCWLWKGTIEQGYGRLYFGGRRRYAHQVAWELANDRTIPKGLCILHSCDTQNCVNPGHLRLGSQEQNMREMKDKGRSLRGSAHPHAKLDEDKVSLIRKVAGKKRITQKEIAELAGISYGQVRKIIAGERWQHVE